MITADLTGKRALVTGGASGIGLGTVELFARLGARVVINDLESNPRLEEQVERLRSEGHDVLAAPGNVGDPDDARAMVEAAVQAMGGLDYLINNAGTPGTPETIPPGDLDRFTEAFWQRLLSVNLLGPFRCIHAAARHLKASRGAIVNTSSAAGFTGRGSSVPYSATKAGLINLTKSLAHGLGPEVRVNAIAPGLVESNWECKFSDQEVAAQTAATPLARSGTPADYAEVILFLCAGGAYVTGHTIVVTGGRAV